VSACVIFQETFNEFKLIGEEIKINQIDRIICTHGDTNAMFINTLTKTKKSSQEIKFEASTTLKL
jgi:hypothetical protein